MIYVTVGFATQPFPRLITAALKIQGELVVLQTPEDRFSRKDHEVMIAKADVVVTHAGAGTILQCWEAKKVPVVVPRMKEKGEHVDSHQVELTKALESYGLVIPVYDVADLPAAIQKAKSMTMPDLTQGTLAAQIAQVLKEV